MLDEELIKQGANFSNTTPFDPFVVVVASYLGMTNSTLSKLRTKLDKPLS
jgi:hypothetical protein